MAAPASSPVPPFLAFCNATLTEESWREEVADLLRREGLSPLAAGGASGVRVTFGNAAFFQERFREMLAEAAAKKRLSPRYMEALNTALARSRGMRFRLERRSPSRRAEGDAWDLRPLTLDVDLLLHFAAARFFAGLEPGRLGRCPECGGFFLRADGRRRLFCRASCRARHHNRLRVESGRQARYMRQRRKSLRAHRKGV